MQKSTKEDVDIQPCQVLTLDILRAELERVLTNLVTEFSSKIDLVVNTLKDEMKNYIDQEISVLIRRLEKVEKDKTPPGSEVWLVAQNLPKVVGESPQQAHEKVSELFEIMGVSDLNIVQCFRTGRSDSHRYIPVMKIEQESKEAVQRAIKAGHKLQRSIFSNVFVRESRPQWVRNQDFNTPGFNIRELARRQGFTMTRGRIQQGPQQQRQGQAAQK